LLFAFACVGFVGVHTVVALDVGPGLFYDEAWLAQQARAFVTTTREGQLPPGPVSAWIFGRPFPLFALPYLGSLKSQLAIAPIALFGNDVATIRLTTFAVAAAALLASCLFTRRAFGSLAAAIATLLIAVDPSFFFHAQWEWGPFTTGFLCRGLGALLLLRGIQEERRASLIAGALVLGLGVYNRADFVLILAAVGLGLLCFHGREVTAWLREQRGALVAASLAFFVGALPTLANAWRVMRSMEALTTRGDFSERLAVFFEVLDGSYPYRLMEVGGRFEAMRDVAAPLGFFGVALLASILWCAVQLLRKREALRDGRGWLAFACIAVAAAMLALPGATRAHHMLNLMPLAQILVALTLASLWKRGSAFRVAAALSLTLIVGFQLYSIEATRSLIQQSGGRGWWSGAIQDFADSVEQADERQVVVSLDWGFHLPLLFSTEKPQLLEPFWFVPRTIEERGSWSQAGDANTAYLVHDAPYDRYGYGPPLLATARSLGERASIRAWKDREGTPAFYSVRFTAPHVLSLARGGYRVRFAD